MTIKELANMLGNNRSFESYIGQTLDSNNLKGTRSINEVRIERELRGSLVRIDNRKYVLVEVEDEI